MSNLNMNALEVHEIDQSLSMTYPPAIDPAMKLIASLLI